jgi:hypothetical protein
MKNKLEQKLDAEFESMNVNPRVSYFKRSLEPFSVISIVDDQLTWVEIKETLDLILFQVIPVFTHEKATKLREALHNRRIYGVAICDRRDTFNRQRGRIIAKGRLLKHLKGMAK